MEKGKDNFVPEKIRPFSHINLRDFWDTLSSEVGFYGELYIESFNRLSDWVAIIEFSR